MPRFFSTVFLIIILSVNVFAADKGKLANDTLQYAHYYRLRYAINNTLHRIIRKKKATVAFLGGSITFNPGWRQMVCNYLQKRFPDTRFRFVAAGIPSLGSLPHAFRLQRDVLDSGRVDLMFVEAAVNDRVNRTDSVTQVKDLEGIVRHALRSNPFMDLVFMEFADPYKNQDYDLHRIPAEISNHEIIASRYGLPSINLAKEVHDKIRNGEFGWDSDFKDLHPSEFGQRLYANNIESFLEACISAYPGTSSRLSRRELPQPLNACNFDSGFYVLPGAAQFKYGWQLLKDWVPADKAQTRPGFVHVPVLESQGTSGVLTLKFKGNAIGIAVVSGPDAGIIAYQIDGESTKKLDLQTEWSGGWHLPWYLLLGSNLKKANHELRLRMSARPEGRPGNVCRIVYFLVNDAASGVRK